MYSQIRFRFTLLNRTNQRIDKSIRRPKHNVNSITWISRKLLKTIIEPLRRDEMPVAVVFELFGLVLLEMEWMEFGSLLRSHAEKMNTVSVANNDDVKFV